MHAVAMKPTYLSKKALEQAVEEEDERKRILKKQVMLEQEFALGEDGEKVRDFLREEGKKLKSKLQVEEFALFSLND